MIEYDMNIIYREEKNFHAPDLQELFVSVNWESGKYPERLQKAMAHSDHVISAWDSNRLVGLINAISDGEITVYFPYLLVRPDYQKQGIGRTLIRMALEHYRSYVRKTLIAYDDAVAFYKSCGFEEGHGKTPMFVSQ